MTEIVGLIDLFLKVDILYGLNLLS